MFGLCRNSSNDVDPRPLAFDTRGSALDIPYALSNGLLTLHEQVAHTNEERKVDLSSLSRGESNGSTVILPSPVNRAKKNFDAFVHHQAYVDTSGELASILEAGKKYRIRLATADLNVKWCRYTSDQPPAPEASGKTQSRMAVKLVNGKPRVAGVASFTVVSSLPRPPLVEVNTRLEGSVAREQLLYKVGDFRNF